MLHLGQQNQIPGGGDLPAPRFWASKLIDSVVLRVKITSRGEAAWSNPATLRPRAFVHAVASSAKVCTRDGYSRSTAIKFVHRLDDCGRLLGLRSNRGRSAWRHPVYAAKRENQRASKLRSGTGRTHYFFFAPRVSRSNIFRIRREPQDLIRHHPSFC